MADVGIKKLGPDLWLVRVARLDHKTGQVVNRKERVKGTKRDALETRDRLRAELRAGSSKPARVRLEDYARSWLESRVATLKPSVSSRYASMLDLHVLPALGKFYVDAITPADVRAYLKARLTTKVSRDPRNKLKAPAGNTVMNELRMLRIIARDSVVDRVAETYWCERVEGPTLHKYTEDAPNLLTGEQLGAMLAHVPVRWKALVMLLATTGLRWGEATGLRWEDVDMVGGVVHVRRSNWKGVIVTPKTKGSIRTVPLLPEVAKLLKPGKAYDLVFPNNRGGLHRTSALRDVLLRALADAGLDDIHLTTHGLRRTFNDLARRVASAQVVKSITGHVTDAMLEHYSLVDRNEKHAVSRRVFDGLAVPALSQATSPSKATERN